MRFRIEFHYILLTKALGKLGNIVVETFVIFDVSSKVLPTCGNIVAETNVASREAKMFPCEFRNI
jgi:hypothetical protein